jgi:hypothetical protein
MKTSGARIGGTYKAPFNFEKEYKHGRLGECRLVKHYCDAFDFYTKDNRFDLVCKFDNEPVEIKTETRYALDKTPNFFIEKISNDVNMKIGGPKRTMRDGGKRYAHYFLIDNVLFWFHKVDKLVERVDKLENLGGLKLIKVPNMGYNTWGYPIRRDLFDDLYYKIRIGVDDELFYNLLKGG